MGKLIVISVDAMVQEDLSCLKVLPNYGHYLAGGSEIKRIKTVYPSVTYPVHVSLLTGLWPEHHRLFSNTPLKPGVLPLPWHWSHKTVKATDLFDYAKKEGLSTGSVFWPVTGNHPSIDYLIAEYWTQEDGESLRDNLVKLGSSPEMLQIIDANMNTMVEQQYPEADNFVIGCSCDIIKKYKPDLMMLHVSILDTYRHQNGVFNDKVTKGIHEVDRMLGQVMSAVKETGSLEDTNLILVSDHGQIGITRIININVLFTDYGLIRVDDQGKVTDWDAYSIANGTCALIFLKDPLNYRIYEKTYNLLRYYCEEGLYGFNRVFTEPEIRAREHLGGDFSFVLETDGYTEFGPDWKRPICQYGNKASHGYLPDKGPQPVFLAKGPGIKNGVTLEKANIIDEAPTFAKLLGLPMPKVDGIAIDDILA
jgi:predicted AlkP superfamily pyrophosphatase or phosphodiesterase